MTSIQVISSVECVSLIGMYTVRLTLFEVAGPREPPWPAHAVWVTLSRISNTRRDGTCLAFHAGREHMAASPRIALATHVQDWCSGIADGFEPEDQCDGGQHNQRREIPQTWIPGGLSGRRGSRSDKNLFIRIFLS